MFGYIVYRKPTFVSRALYKEFIQTAILSKNKGVARNVNAFYFNLCTFVTKLSLRLASPEDVSIKIGGKGDKCDSFLLQFPDLHLTSSE